MKKSSLNKGKHLSQETRDKISKSRIGKYRGKDNPFWGKKHTPEVIARISKNFFKKGDPRIYELHKIRKRSYKGELNPNYGKHHSEEIRQKIRDKLSDPIIKERLKKARALQILPLIDTRIEKRVEEWLGSLSIRYYYHYPLRSIEHTYCCDFFIPEANLVIECDGDYWHGNKELFKELNEVQRKQIERDEIRNIEMKEKGYKVLRLWENRILKMSLEDFREILKSFLEGLIV